MKKLPIGKQHLKLFVEQNLLYVDKTPIIYQLIQQPNYYFLSRPRRFGKSLLLDTLKNIFLGHQHLFKDLWIYDKIEWKTYPVIHLDFSGIDYKEQGLSKAIIAELKNIVKKYDIDLEKKTLKDSLRELIEKLSEKGRVAFLVDEYDKPITDYITNPFSSN